MLFTSNEHNIRPNIHFYDPARETYYTPESFYEKKEWHAHKWHLVKSLAGCNSDNIEGIPGIGEITAIQYLRRELAKDSKRFMEIQSPEGSEIFLRNLDLIQLPHKKTKQFKLQSPTYNKHEFIKLCELYR